MLDQKNQKSNNKVPKKDNPFLNSKIYPLEGVISCDFIDTYIKYLFANATEEEDYDEIEVLPGVTLGNIDDEVYDFEQYISENVLQLMNRLNSNDLNELKNLYRYIKDEMKKSRVKLYDKDGVRQCSDEDYKMLMKKERALYKPSFINTLENLISLELGKEIEDFNSSAEHLIFNIDYIEIISAFNNGQIFGRQKSKIPSNEVPELKELARNMFNTSYPDNDMIFIVCIEINVLIKGLPFAMILNCTEPNMQCYYDGLQIRKYFNSCK